MGSKAPRFLVEYNRCDRPADSAEVQLYGMMTHGSSAPLLASTHPPSLPSLRPRQELRWPIVHAEKID